MQRGVSQINVVLQIQEKGKGNGRTSVINQLFNQCNAAIQNQEDEMVSKNLGTTAKEFGFGRLCRVKSFNGTTHSYQSWALLTTLCTPAGLQQQFP